MTADEPQGPPPSDGDADADEELGGSGLTDEIEQIEHELSEELGEEEAGEAGEAEGEASETVEADTLAQADREEAREAALAGLRERALTEAARRKASPATPTGAHPVTPPAEPPAEVEPVPEPTPAPAAPESTAPAPAAPVPPQPVVAADIGEAPSRGGLWARFLTASLVIIAAMATATSVSALVFVGGIAADLNPLNLPPGLLTPVESSNPETFLVLGSDRRSGETDKGRSDTTILLRVDPQQDAIRLMSIPRDLKVNIPNHGIDKFNAAYTYGGPRLTTKVVKQLTGLDINHVVNIDFLGFADAVNAIGCVYVDVDRHYYIPPESGVAEIDILAGYQRLCGLKALQYVRYRHTDNDLVRSARQQGFLREARAQVPTSELFSPFSAISGQGHRLINIFTKYTSSDIQGTDTVIEMLKLLIAARHAEVHELQFPAELGGPTDPYVTADEASIGKVVAQFLGETPQQASAPSEPAAKGGGKGAGKAKPKEKKPEEKKPEESAPPPMIDATSAGQQYASAVYDKELTPFGVLYPTQIPPGTTFGDDSRSFKIDGPGNEIYHGYKLVIADFTGAYYQYYGISGTDWKDAPILDNPSETRTIGGRDYLLFWDGDRLRLVGWKSDKAAYWVNNDLLETLTPGQMLAMAESMAKYEQ